MKIVVVNGLLKNEVGMSKVLDLIIRELDVMGMRIDIIGLSELEIAQYEGETTNEMDYLFGELLVADAIILASSVHMSNISGYLKNFLDYFELSKYKVALKNKYVYPVLLHNNNEEVSAYNVLFNIIKNLSMLEINKIVLGVPSKVDDLFIEASMKYIRMRTDEFINAIVPKRARETTTSMRNLNKVKLNEILESEDFKEIRGNENNLTLKEEDSAIDDISELTNMVSRQLSDKEDDRIRKIDESPIKDLNNFEENLYPVIEEVKKQMTEISSAINETREREVIDREVIDREFIEEKQPTFQMVNDIDENEDEEVIKETEVVVHEKPKYKTKLEQMMQETLFDDLLEDEDEDDNEVVSSSGEIALETEVESQVVEVSKFEFNDFSEPHEIVPFEAENKEEEIKEEPIIEINRPKASLKDMTKNLIYVFEAPENENINILMQINVSGEEEMKMYINIENNKCMIFDGININSNITIDVNSEKWRKILNGEVTLQKAFMTGMIKVIGNFMLLSKLDKTLFAYNNK